MGGGPHARPDDLRTGRRLGAAVPCLRRGRARRPRHDRRPRSRHRGQPRRLVGAGARPAPGGPGRTRHHAPGRRHRRAHASPRGPCRLGAGPRRDPVVLPRRPRDPDDGGRGSGGRSSRSSRRPSTPCGSLACFARSTGPTRSGRASTSSRPPATRPVISRSGCPPVATRCCSRATSWCTPCSCCFPTSPTPPRTTRSSPPPRGCGSTRRHGAAVRSLATAHLTEAFVSLP